MSTTRTPAKKCAVNNAVPRVRPRRDFAAMEERRMRAADLFAKGVAQAEIARQLGVAHQTVSDWYEKWKTGGKKALRGAGRAGREHSIPESGYWRLFPFGTPAQVRTMGRQG